MRLLFCAALLLPQIGLAADACAMVPRDQITSVLGTTRNTSLNTLPKIPPTASEGKSCQYVGASYTGNIILVRFKSAAAAQEYLKKVRKDLEKQNYKTTSESFEDSTGFSFSNGMFAVRQSLWFRVTVSAHAGNTQGAVNQDLTRLLMQAALHAN